MSGSAHNTMSSSDPIYDPISPLKENPMEAIYKPMHNYSIEKNDEFWAAKAREHLHWFRDFDQVSSGGFIDGDVAWFLNGKLNASVCCIDQHLPAKKDKVALIWDADEPGNETHITYGELLKGVCRIANALKTYGIRKGDVVMIYMPMIPEIVMTMLACARIGAPHSVVFAGFSSEALRDRILDASSKWIITADQGLRGGKQIHLKNIVDAACIDTPCVKHVFMFERTGNPVNIVPERDLLMKDILPSMRPYCPAEEMDSEDYLFLLYTSGSTGRPKGLAHSTGGYLTYAAHTVQNVFDLKENDIYACVADCGWITGHSYVVYGPLLNGATTVLFESVPTYPNHMRYWDLVQRNKITQFYTAPTALRALMRFGTEGLEKYDRSSLRILGTVGEPINPEAWRWYFEEIGENRCSVVDTWWQTETGGHMASPLHGITPMKPGSCCFPLYGINLVLVDAATGKNVEGNGVEGVLCVDKPWPGMARTVYGDHNRYLNIYMKPYPGRYFTGDGARRDKDGYYWITGRVDDVLNPSGHRIGTAEVESALVADHRVAEAAVVGFPHDVKGEGICCYVTLTAGEDHDLEATHIEAGKEVSRAVVFEREFRQRVRDAIGPFATPDIIVITPVLPKTRSGKIMRRILRKIAAGESDQIGDTSTLADPSVVDYLISQIESKLNKLKPKL